MAYPLPVRKTMLYRAIALLAFGVFFISVFVWQAARSVSWSGPFSQREFVAVGLSASEEGVGENTKIAAHFSADELADIVTPSVVRVIQHVGGRAAIAGFSVDPVSLTFTPAPFQKTVRVDAYVSGTGFFVNPEGYALVSARVVSLEGAKQALIARAIETALPFSSDAESLGNAYHERRVALGANIARYLREHSVFHLEQNSVIANPSSRKKKVADLFADGYPVRILSANERFLEDGRDIALVHIDQEGVPALAVSVPLALEAGTTLFIANVPFSHTLSAVPAVAAVPPLIKNTLGDVVQGPASAAALFATDSYGAPEGSGAPIVNESGEVVGMATLASTLPLAQSGMPAVFMLGVASLRDELAERFIIPREGAYAQALRRGIDLLRSRRCREALTAFVEARQANAIFFSADRITAYEGQCGSLIVGDISLTLLWEDVQDRVESLNGPARIAIFGGLFALIMLVLIVVRLFRKIAAKKRTIHDVNKHPISKKFAQKSILGTPRRPASEAKYQPSPIFLKPAHFPFVRKKIMPPLLMDTPESMPPPVSPLTSVPLISSVPHELVTPADAVEQKGTHKLSDEEVARLLIKKPSSFSSLPVGSAMEGGILSGTDEAIGLERPRDPRLRAMLHQLAAAGEDSAPHHHMPAADALWALPDNPTGEYKDGETQTKEFIPPDVDPAVFAYVSDARRVGMSREMMTEELTRAGWSREAIKRAIDARDR